MKNNKRSFTKGARGANKSSFAKGKKPTHKLKRPGRRPTRSTSDEKTLHVERVLDLDINKNAVEYFTKNASFDQHYDAQCVNRDRYIATVMALDEYSIEIIGNSRARALAAAFARHDKQLIDYFLNNKKQFNFSDVLKALNILDSKREKKSIEKKIERVAKTGSVMKAKKLGKLKNDIHNLEKMMPKVGTLTGSIAKLIKRWTRQFSESELEYFVLSMPTEPWKKLANLVHLNPTKDLQASWFLPVCFGQDAPKDSKIDKLRKITAENVNDLIKEYDKIPYSFLKKFKNSLNDNSKELIALGQDKLDTIVWYYEDLACNKVDDIIRSRLEKGDNLELGYGKLMERLLMFKGLMDKKSKNLSEEANDGNSLFSCLIKKAEEDLKNFKATIASPVAVLGDASSSMDVAIRTATIISSLLAAICNAKLTFFNHENFKSKSDPKNVTDVVDVACTTKANGSTSPAASLVPYYDNKEIVKTFIIVTDEEENTDGVTKDGKKWRFFELFKEYRKNVYPASLIFVSFLSHQHSKGQMYNQFVKENIEDVLQFKFDRQRPDLTKLDSILGTICSKSSQTFSGFVERLESDIKTMGLVEAFDKLRTTNSAQENIPVSSSMTTSEIKNSDIENDYEIVN